MSKKRKFNPKRQNEALVNALAQISSRNRDLNVDYASMRDSSQIFSSVAIGLYNTLEGNHDEKVEQIETFLGEVQVIWNRAINGDDVCSECEELTGINIRIEYKYEE